MQKTNRIAVILTLLVNILTLIGCTYQANMIHSLTSSISDNQSQSGNITSQDNVNIIDVDKITGKELRSESRIITLTREQQAEIQRMIDEMKKLVDPSEIRFLPSMYIIHVTAGMIDESILNNGTATDNEYYVIQFYTDMASVDQDTRDTLKQVGCIFYNYIKNYAFYAKIPPEALDTVISMVKDGKVRYLGRVPIEAKCNQNLLSKAQENPDTQFNLVIELFDKANPELVNSLKDIVQVTSYHYDISNDIYGIVLGSNIPNIIAMSHVKWVGEETYGTVANNDETSAVGEEQEYVVLLNKQTAKYKSQILDISGVTYIGDTIFSGTNNEEYPVLVISADTATAEEIKNLDFVIAVSPIAGISPVPVPPSGDEATKANSMSLVIIAGTVALLVLGIITIVYLRKRHGSTSG